MRGLPRVLIALALLLAFALPATAREEIRSFTSAVTVLADGSIDVTETLEVNSEGFQIRRGIFRDIFTTMVNDDRSRLRSNLRVVSVQRDGRPEPYATESINNGVRIRIGDADVFLSDGVHRYTIRYTMTRMVRFFEDHDELYWNATGNYWDFPILRSAAFVTLPDGGTITALDVFTGPLGSEAGEASAERTSDTTAAFRATSEFRPGEGMTIAVAFEKGLIAEPEGAQLFLNWLSDHRDMLLPIIAVLIVLLYNYFAWDSVGRDPRKGTIIPLFHAPKGFSPALVHYIHQMGWKNTGWTAFTASIFDLGVKGLVVIDQAGKALTVKVTGKAPEAKLPPGQAVLFNYFNAKGKVTVDKTTGATINAKRGEMITAIEAENRKVYFNNNTGYILFGAVLSFVMLAGLVFLGVLDPIWLLASIVVGVAIGLLTAAFSGTWAGRGFSRFIVLIWVVIAFGNMFGGFTGWLTSFSVNTGFIAAASIVIINVAFAILLRAPTVQGRKVMDQIEGFRMYIETAEKERLNMKGEPQMTVKRFESILPYAIALGVEKPWSEHFEGELARNAVPDAEPTYAPRWYHGREFSSAGGGFSNAVTAATAGMSAAMVSAQPVSSSSSGFSGGGGSSGGGGGGGGGGGW